MIMMMLVMMMIMMMITRDDLKCPAEDNDVGNEVRAAIANETDILVSQSEYCSFITAELFIIIDIR